MTKAHLGCLVVACLLAFSNVFQNGFHLDDAYRIQDNPGVQRFDSPFRHFADAGTSSQLPRLVQYRPLLPLSLSINYAIAGDSLIGYHIGNLLFQVIASVLVYFLVRELLTHWTERDLSPHLPVFVALMFAVHPVSGVPVNYLCSRDLQMMQLFMVGALLAYVRMRRLGERPLRWAGCLLLVLLSLLAKKNVVVLPALVGLFELLFTQGSWRRLWRVLPFAAWIGGYLLVVRFGIGFSDVGNVVPENASSLEYGVRQLQHHVFHYLRNFAWPLPLRMGAVDALATWKSVVGGLCLVASWGLAAYWWRRRPVLAFAILGYQLLLVLTSSVLPLHDDIVAYRPYPASPFLFLGVGVLVGGWLRRRPRTLLAVIALVTGYLGGMSFVLNRVWQNEVTRGTHTVSHGGNARAHYNLANSLPDGDPQQIPNFERALALSPNYIVAHLGYGMARLRLGDVDGGIEQLRHAISLDREQAQSYHYLAKGLDLFKKDYQGAADAAARACELDPRNIQYRYYAAQRASVAGRFETVTRLLAPIDHRMPDYRDTQYLLGYAFQKIRNWPRAIEHFEKCLQYQPKLRELHLHLAKCYRAVGNRSAAERHQRLHDQGK